MGAPSRSAHASSWSVGRCQRQSSGAPTRGVGAQSSEQPEQLGLGALLGEGRGETGAAPHVDVPGGRVGGDGVEVLVAGQHRGGGLRAPARQAGEPVGAVADEGQPVRDAGRRHAVLGPHRGFVEGRVVTAVELHDPRVADALGEVLVGGADHDPFHAGVGDRDGRRGGQRVVGFERDLGPHRDAERVERVFEDGELGEEGRFDSFAGLVSGPEIVAERLDDVVGGDADVGRALLEELQDREDDAPGRADVDPVGRSVLGHREVVAEQLVGAVDEVGLHAPCLSCAVRSDRVGHRHRDSGRVGDLRPVSGRRGAGSHGGPPRGEGAATVLRPRGGTGHTMVDRPTRRRGATA